MARMKINLTAFAHGFARERMRAGGFFVDATAGNGHDTAFLAEIAGEAGRVDAFDVQPEALEATRERLERSGLSGRVSLHLCGHENMAERLGPARLGTADAVFFNLGYLPRSDRRVKTRAETTLRALDAAWALLAPGGFISLTVYTRHEGGFEESAQVAARLEKMRGNGDAELFLCGAHNPVEPWWAGVVKRARGAGRREIFSLPRAFPQGK